LADALARRLGAQPRRNDVGTPAEQLRRDIGRQRKRASKVDARCNDLQAAVGPGADECRDAIALQAELLGERDDIGFGRRAARLRRAHAGERLEPILVALAEEFSGLGAHVARRRRGIERGVQPRELGICGGDRCGERDARLRFVGARGVRFRSGGGKRRAVLAPEVELPGEVERGTPVVVPALRRGRGRRQIVAALLLLGDRASGRYLRQRGGASDLCIGTRAIEPRFRYSHGGGAIEGFGDQCVELWIAVVLPPGVGRPDRGGRGERYGGRVCIGGLGSRQGVRLRQRGAAAERGGDEESERGALHWPQASSDSMSTSSAVCGACMPTRCIAAGKATATRTAPATKAMKPKVRMKFWMSGRDTLISFQAAAAMPGPKSDSTCELRLMPERHHSTKCSQLLERKR